MWQGLLSTPLLAAAFACLLAVAASAQPQDAVASASLETGVVLTKLTSPVYPPLAKQARIVGDVKVVVAVRKDRSIESVDVVSGPAMLRQAAVDSARKSTFVCRGCDATASFSLTYTFETSGDCRFGPKCEALEPRAPEVTQSEGRISLVVEPACTCDPAATMIRVRAAKCLYLWKCGFREVEDK
jgi:hypothetical protein